MGKVLSLGVVGGLLAGLALALVLTPATAQQACTNCNLGPLTGLTAPNGSAVVRILKPTRLQQRIARLQQLVAELVRKCRGCQAELQQLLQLIQEMSSIYGSGAQQPYLFMAPSGGGVHEPDL